MSARLARDTAVFFATRIAILLLSLGLTVAIAWKLGGAGLGGYGLMIALGYVFQSASALGLVHLFPREVGRHPDDTRSLFAAALTLAVPAAIVFALGLAALARALGYPPELRHALDLMAVSLVPGGFSQIAEALFVARGRADRAARLTAIENVLRCGASFVALLAGGELVALAWMFLLARIAGTLTAAAMIDRPLLGNARLAIRPALRDLTRRLPTFAALYAAAMVYLKVDMVLLSVLRDQAEVGVYSAAYRLLEVASLLPATAASIVYPAFARLREEDPAKLADLATRALTLLYVATLPILLSLSFGAEGIVALLFPNAAFRGTVWVLRILPWTLVPYAADVILGHVMLAAERQRDDLRFVALGISAGVATNLLLVPALGATGAALANVVASLVMAKLHVRFVHREIFRVRVDATLARALPAVLVAGAFLAYFGAHSPLWVIPGGLVLYAATAALTGAIRMDMVRSVLGERGSARRLPREPAVDVPGAEV